VAIVVAERDRCSLGYLLNAELWGWRCWHAV
jgi:hypothetical protein